MYDEWIENISDGMAFDTGDAIDRIDGLKKVAELVLAREAEL